ncbi:agmatine deiminase family protein [Pediococcus acidilactici]
MALWTGYPNFLNNCLGVTTVREPATSKWDKDQEVTGKLADLFGWDRYQSDFILEGCSVVTDGEGTLITTEEVVLSEGRNKGITKAQAEAVFQNYLGAQKVIWLPEGFFLDEAGGDVDNMVNFIRPGEVMLSWTDNPSDPQHRISQRAYDILSQTTDARGRNLIIHKMDLPQRPVKLTALEAEGVDPINGMLPRTEGQRLTATYVNYITLDQAIIFRNLTILTIKKPAKSWLIIIPTGK